MCALSPHRRSLPCPLPTTTSLETWLAGGDANDTAQQAAYLAKVKGRLSAGRQTCVCLVCLEVVGPRDASWHCGVGCYQTFHMECIREWARKNKGDAQQRQEARQEVDAGCVRVTVVCSGLRKGGGRVVAERERQHRIGALAGAFAPPKPPPTTPLAQVAGPRRTRPSQAGAVALPAVQQRILRGARALRVLLRQARGPAPRLGRVDAAARVRRAVPAAAGMRPRVPYRVGGWAATPLVE